MYAFNIKLFYAKALAKGANLNHPYFFGYLHETQYTCMKIMNTKGTDMSCVLPKKNHKHMISTKSGYVYILKKMQAKRKTILNVNVRIIISLFYNG